MWGCQGLSWRQASGGRRRTGREGKGEKQENRGRVLKEVKEVMAAVTLMQPAAQEANDQYR